LPLSTKQNYKTLHEAKNSSKPSKNDALDQVKNKKERLLRLQQLRAQVGTWVQCTVCSKWRYLASVTDPQQVHPQWVCSMNEGTGFINAHQHK
jgi:hypothetical protein